MVENSDSTDKVLSQNNESSQTPQLDIITINI